MLARGSPNCLLCRPKRALVGHEAGGSDRVVWRLPMRRTAASPGASSAMHEERKVEPRPCVGAFTAPAPPMTSLTPAAGKSPARLIHYAKVGSAARRTQRWCQLTRAPVQGSKRRERLHSEAKVIRGDRHLKVTRRSAERLGLCISEIKGDPLLPATGRPDSPGALK